jgi:hypothetical protein
MEVITIISVTASETKNPVKVLTQVLKHDGRTHLWLMQVLELNSLSRKADVDGSVLCLE